MTKEELEAALKKALGRGNSKPKSINSDASSLVMANLKSIKMKDVPWKWDGRIASGATTIFAGEPGITKSLLTAEIAAIISTGGKWPCNEGTAPKGRVLVLSAEDSPEYTLKPRLVAAGADERMVEIVRAVDKKDGNGERLFDLQEDLSALEAKINEFGDVAVVIIDPFEAYLGDVDSHKSAALRRILTPIRMMAERTGVAVVGVWHLNKAVGQKVINRIMGSLASVADARIAFGVMADPEDETGIRRLILHIKNNLAPAPKGLAYIIGSQELPGLKTPVPVIGWETNHVDMKADDIAAASSERSDDPTMKEACAEFLQVLLIKGRMVVPEIEQQAIAAGILKEGTPISQCKPIRSARKELDIKVYQEARHWYWEMPKDSQMPSNASGALINERASDIKRASEPKEPLSSIGALGSIACLPKTPPGHPTDDDLSIPEFLTRRH